MSKDYEGVNRCDRCDRPLSDPTANYGWRCAQIMGLTGYTNTATGLDGEQLLLYNDYAKSYLPLGIQNINSVAYKSENNEFTEWIGKMFKAQYDTVENMIDTFDEKQKEIQRSIWSIGADMFLREKKNFLTSAWVLEHSLEDNPSDIWRGNDSRIACLVNTDNAYLNALDEAIRYSSNNRLDHKKISVQLETGDLYYSIHKSDIYLTGYKQENGRWIINAVLNDTYDFTEIQTLMTNGKFSMQAGLGTIANDAAVISQQSGAITPYMITVDFWTTR